MAEEAVVARLGHDLVLVDGCDDDTGAGEGCAERGEERCGECGLHLG